MPNRVRLLVLLSLLTGGTVAPVALPAQQRPRCDSPEHRQFDFWIGEWTVTAAGKPAGHNLITLEEDGCVLHEHWTGAGGGTGQSFNFYDRQDGQWHQLWIDNAGQVLRLAGQYEQDEMRLAGESRGRDGVLIENRLTFSRNPDGSVRQLWVSRRPGQPEWTVVFDGLYVRR
ncbi:MAG: hypothetical protein OEW44_02310 [Gemmatimonadota bacterium]|jgi:hypothetical protein|nr:hypothetical protein [Gemmatimonadota bacterium]